MVLAASVVFLLPGRSTASVTSLASGRYIDWFGARAVLISTGPRLWVAGFVLLATAAFRALAGDRSPGVANAYISLAYGVPPPWWSGRAAGETGGRDEHETPSCPHDRQFDRRRRDRGPLPAQAPRTDTPRRAAAPSSSDLGAGTAVLAMVLIMLHPPELRIRNRSRTSANRAR